MSEAQQEKPADSWGQPISEERQMKLAASKWAKVLRDEPAREVAAL